MVGSGLGLGPGLGVLGLGLGVGVGVGLVLGVGAWPGGYLSMAVLISSSACRVWVRVRVDWG